MGLYSALYVGHVRHRRVRPKIHALRYRFFWMLLDLAELPAIERKCRFFSVGKFNLFSFHEQDHLMPGGDLRGQVTKMLEQAGIAAGGAIRLLSLPRVLGFVFNPISLFFCYDRAGALVAMLYEVNNTFGQRHCYLFDVHAEKLMVHCCKKEFYVSPFMTMDMDYEFRVMEPGAHHMLRVDGGDERGLLISTNFTGRREELSDRGLLWRILSHPLLTLKIVAGIHLEALLLWLKGVRLVPRPPAPAHLVTFVPQDHARG